MADTALLAAVKTALGVTSDYMDATISLYIDSVVDYMRGAGVSAELCAVSVGVVSRGVNDIWTGAAGGAEYSKQFYDMVSQFVLRSRG